MGSVGSEMGVAPIHLTRPVLVGLDSHGWLLPGRRGEDLLHLDDLDLAFLVRLTDTGGGEVAGRLSLPPTADAGATSVEVDRWHRLRGRLPLGAAAGPAHDLPLGPRGSDEVRPVDPVPRWQVPVPLTFVVRRDGLGWVDPLTGVSLVLDAQMLRVVRALLRPLSVDELGGSVGEELGLGRGALATALGRLRSVGLVVEADTRKPVLGTGELLKRRELVRNRELFRASAELEKRRVRPSGRTRVVPVSYPLHLQPTALGLLLSYAQVYDGGRLWQDYDLEPVWHVSTTNIDRVLDDTGPAVFLFSHYVWSTDRIMEVSRRVKERSPESVTIHGGPNVPRHEVALPEWMRANPHVDVAVRSEGEVTTAEVLAALGGRLREHAGDLSVLRDVAGLTYRTPAGDIIRTPDRQRLVDLDAIPSPFLNGIFEPWEQAGTAMAVIETSRGCPYSCAFCDWGSATTSRIRKYSLERVFADLEWVGRARATRLSLTDSNFGIFARDVEVARKLAEVRARYGYPDEVFCSFAKNTTKYTAEIIRILVEAGMIATGVISLQTTDPDTLRAVERQNIHTDKYNELARVFREQRLPLVIELMYGLPGQTPEAFRGDLQHCVDIEVPPRLYRTQLLVNSPMNDPEYLARWAIETEEVIAEEPLDLKRSKQRRRVVLASSTFTEDDLVGMTRLGDSFGIFENYGFARHFARWVRHRTGRPEVDLYQLLDHLVVERPDDHPALWAVVETLFSHSAVPLHWSLFTAELRRIAVEELALDDDSELETVLRVQEAHLPARGRLFPDRLELPHDYVAWHAALLEAKEKDFSDWVDRVPPLSSLGRGILVVNDPFDVCSGAMGSAIDINLGDNWELDSPVSRSTLAYRRG